MSRSARIGGIARVALVTPRYAPAIGGVERHVEELARGLVGRGVAVEVVTTDPSGRLPTAEERDGVVVRRFPTVANDGVFFVSPALGAWLDREAGRFDLLHAHSYHTPLALQATLAGRRAGTPVVLTPHYHGTGHSTLRRLLHGPYRLPGRWLVRAADGLIAVSEAERGLLRRHFGEDLPVEVVPNGVDVGEFAGVRPFPTAPGAMVVLAGGRLESYKRVDRLVAAVPSLPTGYEVVIVGDGPARSAIARDIARCGAGDRVRMLGRVPRGELLRWYRTADVFVSLSEREAFGLAMLEAAVAGAGVVASDIPAHREVARWLPVGRVARVGEEVGPAGLARAVARVAARERAPANLASLPSWSGMVDGVLACYRAARERAGAAWDVPA